MSESLYGLQIFCFAKIKNESKFWERLKFILVVKMTARGAQNLNSSWNDLSITEIFFTSNSLNCNTFRRFFFLKANKQNLFCFLRSITFIMTFLYFNDEELWHWFWDEIDKTYTNYLSTLITFFFFYCAIKVFMEYYGPKISVMFLQDLQCKGIFILMAEWDRYRYLKYLL